ncbi:MAG: M15 family metallopeptidase [Lachnospiraceae bacterium]|nr:M15 family metallopeptidase [Lachnospiraceae bacterium]
MFSGMQGRSYREGCPVPREDLVCVHALHVDAGGVTHTGEMICNRCIADRVLGILEELYENNYPIERMEPVDSYGGDDERSMEANNSSCFNFRMVSNTNVISKHGMGLAVDINPLYNPCVRKVNGVLSVEPETGKPYADRTGDFEYKIVKDDLCYRLFRENGFVWGGEWKSLKDYQHFEVPDEVSDELMKEYLQAK